MAYCGILFLILFSVISFTEGNSQAVPAHCQPWKVPIEVDPPNHSHRPFYIEMHRCLGQCTKIPVMSPLQCECVADTTKDVVLKVTTPEGLKSRTFKNHTSCRSQCKADYKQMCVGNGHQWNEPTCSCTCPTGSCPQNEIWNSNTCQCECASPRTSCRPGMFWNKSSCSCQCSVKAFARCSRRRQATNLKTCACGGRPPVAGTVVKNKTNESEKKLVISLAVICLLLGTLFIVDLVLLRSNMGFMYGLKTKCNERRKNKELANAPEAETGSMGIDTDINYPVENGNYKHKHHYVTQDSITSV